MHQVAQAEIESNIKHQKQLNVELERKKRILQKINLEIRELEKKKRQCLNQTSEIKNTLLRSNVEEQHLLTKFESGALFLVSYNEEKEITFLFDRKSSEQSQLCICTLQINEEKLYDKKVERNPEALPWICFPFNSCMFPFSQIYLSQHIYGLRIQQEVIYNTIVSLRKAINSVYVALEDCNWRIPGFVLYSRSLTSSARECTIYEVHYLLPETKTTSLLKKRNTPPSHLSCFRGLWEYDHLTEMVYLIQSGWILCFRPHNFFEKIKNTRTGFDYSSSVWLLMYKGQMENFWVDRSWIALKKNRKIFQKVKFEERHCETWLKHFEKLNKFTKEYIQTKNQNQNQNLTSYTHLVSPMDEKLNSRFDFPKPKKSNLEYLEMETQQTQQTQEQSFGWNSKPTRVFIKKIPRLQITEFSTSNDIAETNSPKSPVLNHLKNHCFVENKLGPLQLQSIKSRKKLEHTSCQTKIFSKTRREKRIERVKRKLFRQKRTIQID